MTYHTDLVLQFKADSATRCATNMAVSAPREARAGFVSGRRHTPVAIQALSAQRTRSEHQVTSQGVLQP